MSVISDIRIGVRLALGFGLILLCAGLLLTLGLWRMSDLHSNTGQIVTQRVASLTNAMGMKEIGSSLALSLRKMVTPTNQGHRIKTR